MSIIDQLLHIIAPHECLFCTAEGSLLCADCVRGANGLRPAASCYRCRRLSFVGGLCATCRSTIAGPINQVYRAVAYQGAAKQLVVKLKFGNTPAAAKTMVQLMRPTIEAALYATTPLLPMSVLVVPVPTASSRIRQRGYNQAELLARHLSRQLALPRADCLARVGQQHQLGANRQQRLVQLAAALRLKTGQSVAGRHILLVDDVLTTGATLEAAAAVLLAAGAKQVDAAVFAQA